MCSSNPGVATNTPARIRMTTLYAVAALVGGRVVNTCNWSENYVGYSTKYGDAAGDFSIFHDYTVREIMAIGDYLELPILLVHKVPSDGMCGSSDEEKLGLFQIKFVGEDWRLLKRFQERVFLKKYGIHYFF